MFKNTSKWLYLYYLSTQLSFTKLKKCVTYSCDSFMRILIVEYMSSPSKPSVLDKVSLTQLSYWNYRNTAMRKKYVVTVIYQRFQGGHEESVF